jgi:hypothetical protein
LSSSQPDIKKIIKAAIYDKNHIAMKPHFLLAKIKKVIYFAKKLKIEIFEKNLKLSYFYSIFFCNLFLLITF